MTTAAPQLAGRAHQMRSLVREGRYAEAQGVFEEYCAALAQILGGLQPKDPRIRQLEEDWRSLLGELRRRVLTGRAHAAVRLSGLPKLPAPYRGTSVAHQTWELTG